jgi:hypothetical protein
MSRKDIFFDQPKPKQEGYTLHRRAREAKEYLTNESYEGPGDNAITNQKFGRSSGSNN